VAIGLSRQDGIGRITNAAITAITAEADGPAVRVRSRV
jgi:hypothetical protein